MANHPLIIVESPTKVKTIKRFLGSGISVAASGGHVRDLPKSRMGVKLDEDFEPEYITIRGKGDVLKELKTEAKKATKIYLATDPDREGEAIAWHLKTLLEKENANCCRISFNEITKTAVKNALATPRELDMNLVNAQQARRVLDRVAGYSVSPLLWKKVKKGLSAGRVQSAALNMICTREEEIDRFVPEEFWTLGLTLETDGGKTLSLEYEDKEKKLTSESDVKTLISSLEGRRFTMESIETQSRRIKAPLPFTTSTLQQEASKTLNLSPGKTMSIAQQLYEGVNIRGEGTVGLITYLRTDSTRISAEADAAVRSYIRGEYGADYLGFHTAQTKETERIQDAHEAIRPSSVERTPASIKEMLSRDEFRLYQLIWNRFVASRMADMVYDSTQLTVRAGDALFKTSAKQQIFDGFRMIYNPEKVKAEKDRSLAGITAESRFEKPGFDPKQHFTQAPAHYTEASLVHAMESCGIGRPSTYAPTIATLMARRYINRDGRNLFVTELGEAVNRITLSSVPMLADRDFTAGMENRLDEVADGSLEWKQVVRDFYPPFKEKLDQAMAELEKVKIEDEVTDEICELCGRHMVIKYGPHGRFLACPGFPECRNAKPFLEKTGLTCPKCGGAIIIRKSKKGRRFYGCEHSPECDYFSWTRPQEKKTEKAEKTTKTSEL